MHHQFGLNGWNQIDLAKFASKNMRQMDYFCLLKPNWLWVLIKQAQCRDRLKCSSDGRLEQQKFTFQIDQTEKNKHKNSIIVWFWPVRWPRSKWNELRSLKCSSLHNRSLNSRSFRIVTRSLNVLFNFFRLLLWELLSLSEKKKTATLNQ